MTRFGIKFTSSTSADYVIPLFTRVFDTYGISEEIKMDNGLRLMDKGLQTLLGNKGSDTERSPLGGLKLMVTWSVSCKPSRGVREFLNFNKIVNCVAGICA